MTPFMLRNQTQPDPAAGADERVMLFKYEY
jgi:hypothetical protein